MEADNNQVRAVNIVVPELRYDGRKIDEEVLAMVPVLKDADKKKIKDEAIKWAINYTMVEVDGVQMARDLDLQDLMAQAEFLRQSYAIISGLVEHKVAKIKLDHKDKWKEETAQTLETMKKRKVNESVEKLGKDPEFKHVVLGAIEEHCELTAPPAAQDTKNMKKALDSIYGFVQVDMPITEELIRGIFKTYSVTQYFKFKKGN
jgi:hypothetical protein